LTGEATSVIHYHYTGWPDFGVPENSNVLIQLVLDLQQLQPHMTVIHCSAGVGRTGTFLAMSRLMDEIDDGVQSIDVFSTVLALRKDRRFMVTFYCFCQYHYRQRQSTLYCRYLTLLCDNLKKRMFLQIVT
jgi:receptor-type tyrosine-protein phosphatase beta